MDGDTDIVLLDEFLQRVHRIGCWCGGNILDSRFLRELEHTSIGRGVFGEAIHAVCGDRQSESLDLGDHLLDVIVACIERKHPAKEFDLIESEVLGVIQGDVDRKASQRIDLQTEFQPGCFGFLCYQSRDRTHA